MGAWTSSLVFMDQSLTPLIMSEFNPEIGFPNRESGILVQQQPSWPLDAAKHDS